MANIIRDALSLYFSAVLGISGLAKIDQLESFITTLTQQRIIPRRGVRIIGIALSWGEIFLALILLLGISLPVAAVITLVIFVAFLITNSALVRRGWETDCGCYGKAYPQKVDTNSIITSIIYVAFSVVYVISVFYSNRNFSFIRNISTVVTLTLFSVIAVQITRRKLVTHKTLIEPVSYPQVPSLNITIGDMLPEGFEASMGPKTFLTFMGHGCPHCIYLYDKLSEIDTKDWILIFISRETEEETRIPLHAQLIVDNEERKSHMIGVYATPTTLALIHGHLIDFSVGAHIEWFTDTISQTATMVVERRTPSEHASVPTSRARMSP